MFVLYLLSTSCVHTLAYSTLFLSFSLGDTLLLLSSRRRGGVHAKLPGVRGLLGGRLPVDVPVAPRFRVSYCFTLPHICTRHYVIYVINNIRTRFIMSFYVICAVINCLFYCIYVWLDSGTYMIARFMSFCKPGVTPIHGVVRVRPSAPVLQPLADSFCVVPQPPMHSSSPLPAWRHLTRLQTGTI